MLQPGRRQRAVIAFRVKSGWATAVLLTGPMDNPVVLDASIADLSDPKIPGSKQPYHNGMYVARKEGPQLERLLAGVAAYSQRSLATLLSKYVATGYHLSEAGLVVGSDCDPAVIMNPHIRVHAEMKKEKWGCIYIFNISFIQEPHVQRSARMSNV